MTKKWKKKESETITVTPYFTLKKDTVEDFNENDQVYWYLDDPDGVMIVPIRIEEDGNKIIYTMVNQYRYPTGDMQLEFPKGTAERGESKEDTARRELLEETGLNAKWLKFMYSFCHSVGRSVGQVAVYLALVEGEPNTDNAELSELGGGLEPVEISADDLLVKVQNNEIRDSHTLAALAAVMLQSNEAKRYFENIGQE